MRVLGCVGLGFAVTRDDRIPSDSLLLHIALRNHCVHPSPLNVAALALTGYDASGTPVAMTMYDPRHEIRPEEVDIEADTTEHIRVDGPGSLADLPRVCVDVSRVSKDARLAAPAPVCLFGPWLDDRQAENAAR